MKIIMLGAPGAGKGTQAKMIADKYSVPHISTGDIFRANIKNGTELGMEAKKYMDQGLLVPDELTVKILLDRVAQDDCKNGYVLDGFPRTIPQAKVLDDELTKLGETIDYAIDVNVPDENIINTEMTLERHGDGLYLAATPVREIENLRKESNILTDITLADELLLDTGAAPLDISIELAMDGSSVTLGFFGSELMINTAENTVKYKNITMPLSLTGDKAKLRALIDQGSLTVFADNGKFCTTQKNICDFNLPYVTLTSDRQTQIERFECHILNSIYNA